MAPCSSARQLFPLHSRGRKEEAATRAQEERLWCEGDAVEGMPSQRHSPPNCGDPAEQSRRCMVQSYSPFSDFLLGLPSA